MFAIDTIHQPEVDWSHLPVEKRPDGSEGPVWLRTWTDYHLDCKKLARKLQLFADRECMRWWGMIIIPRGGLVGGGIVARELNIRTIETLPMTLYDDTRLSGQQARSLLEFNPHFEKLMRERGRGCLIFDDLIDTKTTNFSIRQRLGALVRDAHFATLYVKAGGEGSVNTYLIRVPSREIWVRHPWDLDLQFAESMAGAGGN